MTKIFKVGDAVVILDQNRNAIVSAISDDGTQFTLTYKDAGGAEQTEVRTADQLQAVGEGAGSDDEETGANEGGEGEGDEGEDEEAV